MATVKKRFDGCETQAQIDACLELYGLTVNKMIRYRRKGLLAGVEQEPHHYHGSAVYYPAGTCAQIAALARHLRKRADLNYVGHQLWLEGYPVHERYWRPQLIKTAQRLDRAMRLVRRFLAQDEGSSGSTLQERVAASTHSNIVTSRIRRRLSGEALAAHFGVLLSVATGDFRQSSLSETDEQSASDRKTTITAFDIGASETDTVLGQKLRLTNALPQTLQDISRAYERDTFLHIAEGPTQVIFDARDDVRNSLRAGLAMYDAFSWIYGAKAFGLRLLAWIARKKTDQIMCVLILGFALLRQHSTQLYSSAEIAALADKAEQARRDSLRIRELGKSDPHFRKVFSRKRVRDGMRDQPSHNNWTKEIALARLE